ncbi:PCC domain-containing protein [Nocardia rhizosphaerihabitans]|uniref:PCC domain-containing protein n=1 Tax=Nocardia rhizosphaerihabitans TaxID=1691570 RepID=UPI0036712022
MSLFELKDCDLVEALQQQVTESGITNASVLLIGAVDTFKISTMPAHDASDDIVSEYRLPAEMHGTGEVVNGKVHLHASFAVQGDRVYGGHVHAASIGTWFVRAYVTPTTT